MNSTKIKDLEKDSMVGENIFGQVKQAKPTWEILLKKCILHIFIYRFFFLLFLFIIFLSIIILVELHQLQKTSIEFHLISLSDLCLEQSTGQLNLTISNPSYFFQPVIGPIDILITTQSIVLLTVTIPSLQVLSGSSGILWDVFYSIHVHPHQLYHLIFESSNSARITQDFSLSGTIPLTLSIFSIPFTFHYPIEPYLSSSPPHLILSSPYLLSPHHIAQEILDIMQKIASSMALSHSTIQENATHFYASTSVDFEYNSKFQCIIPSLQVQLYDQEKEHSLSYLGFNSFQLGNGISNIKIFTYLPRKEISFLTDILYDLLSGHDQHLVLQGSIYDQYMNYSSFCYVKKMVNFIQLKLRLPGKTNQNEPIFFKKFLILPSLKRLDSNLKICDLLLKLDLYLHNPFPFIIYLNDVSYNLSFYDPTNSSFPVQSLGKVALQHPKMKWSPHTTKQISFQVHTNFYSICSHLVEEYFQNHLMFNLDHGEIQFNIFQKNLSIPFSISNISLPSIPRSQFLLLPPDDDEYLDSWQNEGKEITIQKKMIQEG